MRKPQKSRPGFATLYWSLHIPCVIVRVFTQTIPERRWIYLLSNRIQAGLLVLGGVIYLLNELRIRRQGRIDEALTERPEGLVEYPVEATVFVNNQPIGMDRGVVYFEDGRFGFVGSSFSFLLAAEDFVDHMKAPLMKRQWRAPKLTLRATGGKAYLSVKPLIGHGRAYRASLKEFFREAKVVEGERQWPPLSAFRADDLLPSLPEETVVEPEAVKVSS